MPPHEQHPCHTDATGVQRDEGNANIRTRFPRSGVELHDEPGLLASASSYWPGLPIPRFIETVACSGVRQRLQLRGSAGFPPASQCCPFGRYAVIGSMLAHVGAGVKPSSGGQDFFPLNEHAAPRTSLNAIRSFTCNSLSRAVALSLALPY